VTLSIDDFSVFHASIHGYAPFEWQTRLLRQICSERRWPRVLDLPTGAGKTSCIDIALFALALDAYAGAERFAPLRIAMVVDRRLVVDQVADRGRKLLGALCNPVGREVKEVAKRLTSLSRTREAPIGVFTLRGGIPKDDGWARTPDQPLVLASTVDQIGSRLLVQGYGLSRGMRPVHAGLLGNDTLLLLDEVHLSQPFAETLDQVDALRVRFTSQGGIASRFAHVFLSATPSASAAPSFRLHEEETRLASALGPRLHAKKLVSLHEAAERTAVEKVCVDEARSLVDRHELVAVVMNRVRSAATVSAQLREALAGVADVFLVTGRMRALDRDDLLTSLRPRIMTGRVRPANRKTVVVATQCIEAGADFDFDAMVTEAASLDALRQRFGRVDRLGVYGRAEGAIVRDKEAKDDPIYGKAITETMKWLKEHVDRRSRKVDFGVLALPLPEAERHSSCLAPKPQAPILLPAYLDLWMQSSPSPSVVPDLSLFLHGPAAGPADVQVIWRADLSEADLSAARSEPEGELGRGPVNVVAALRPSGLEAVSIPFVAAREWLCGQRAGDFGDVEGAGLDSDGRVDDSRLALRWKGDESEVVVASELRPGDTIVVPHTRGGLSQGTFDPSATPAVTDLAERAALLGRGQPALRLHAEVLKQLGLPIAMDDETDSRTTLATIAEDEAQPAWRRAWLRAVAAGALMVVDGTLPFQMVVGRRIRADVLRKALAQDHQEQASLEEGADLTTDDDDSFHAGKAVPLAKHSADVERFARTYAEAAGLSESLVNDLALAGWLHDVGKADRRFQVLLRGGSEIAFLKDETVLAKSGMASGAKAAHRQALRLSGYPAGGRHEVQSVAMLDGIRAKLDELARDPELVLYLVGCHHGHCRPFAPAIQDTAPVQVRLEGHTSERFGAIDFSETSSAHNLHRLDGPLADRFWSLIEKYGWFELCWMEAILRLADHRASEEEVGG
jgi:CRISPR-associated endonuclease/helicase Cas3